VGLLLRYAPQKPLMLDVLQVRDISMKRIILVLTVLISKNPIMMADKEPFYEQITRAVIRLEHIEQIKQEGSQSIITKRIPAQCVLRT
jgi:hypothetical protein